MSIASDKVVIVPMSCAACGQTMEIECAHVGGFAYQQFYRIDCPYCEHVSHPQLPGEPLDVLKAGESWG